MHELDLKRLIDRVNSNCDISDAKFWGAYSICGMLLRLRGKFRKERGIKPWEEIPRNEISEWISERESLWHRIEKDEYLPLSLGGKEYPPFEAEDINKALEGTGVIYGAGLGENMKPSFFLAELISKTEMEGNKVYIAGDEFVRDLSLYPAMLLRGVIFVRKESVSLYLWDKFEEARIKRNRGALSYAFSHYGVNSDEPPSEELFRKIRAISDCEIETYIYHELGEAHEGDKLGGRWKEILAASQNRRVEIFLRGLKDVLADTSEKGTLRHIIKEENKGSLGFYLSFLGGFRKLLVPEITRAFSGFMITPDWLMIEKAAIASYSRASKIAARVLSLCGPQDDGSIDEIVEKEIMADLLTD